MDSMDKFKEAKAKMKAAMEEANKVVKDAFKDASQTLFTENTGLVSFGWKQYTPYFNDGDECIFGAHTCEPNINGECGYDLPEEHDALATKVREFLATFDDDDFKTMFGDHCEVTVTPTEIEVEEYEHD